MARHKCLLARSAAFAALSVAASAHAETRIVYVDASRPTNGDGSSWQQAFRDLQDAFDSINDLPIGSVREKDVEFRIAKGTYRPAETRQYAFAPRAPALTSAASLTIAGGYGGVSSPTPDARDFVATPTILTADVLGNDQPGFQGREDNCSHALCSGLTVDTPSRRTSYLFRVSGLTLEGATPDLNGRGGGFVAALNHREQNLITQFVTLEDCLIRDNAGGANSGGVTTSGWSPGQSAYFNIIRCNFERNASTWRGGAVSIPRDFFVGVVDSSFVDNEATHAGGAMEAH